MGSAVLALRRKYQSFGNFAGVGVGTPGPLELPAGVIRHAPNLPGWDGFDVRSAMEACIGEPIQLECDANAAALAEFVQGAASEGDVASLCMLTLGTGVGCGLILDGQIWHGDHGMGGESGHMTVYPDGHACGCGSHGCLEQYASATAVKRMALEVASDGKDADLRSFVQGNPNFNAKDFAEFASAGNPAAIQVFQKVGKALGLAMASLVNTLDLQLYVIGGGLIGAWDLFAPTMMGEIERRSYVYRISKNDSAGRVVRIEPAALGAGSGIVGAAALPYQLITSVI
jgi:glucokinase